MVNQYISQDDSLRYLAILKLAAFTICNLMNEQQVQIHIKVKFSK